MPCMKSLVSTGSTELSAKQFVSEALSTVLRGEVKIQLPRPPMCHSQLPPAATGRLEQIYLE